MSNVLGERIKMLRNEYGLTQLELSLKLNIGNTTLSQYESGQRIPSDEIKMKICDYFDVSMDYLLGRVENPKAKHAHLNDLDEHSIESFPLEANITVSGSSQNIKKLISYLNENGFDFEVDSQEFIKEKQAPLSIEMGDLIIQRALKNTGIISEDGTLSDEGVKVISDFLANNADILKKLIDKN